MATLLIAPEALAATATWKVTVTLPPETSVTVPDRLLAVVAVPTKLEPTVAVPVTLVIVPRPAGRLSRKVAFVAVLGPLFVITRLYVSVPPAVGVALPAVLTRLRSAEGVTVTVAVPVLLPGVVSVVPGGTLTVATLLIAPEALAASSF